MKKYIFIITLALMPIFAFSQKIVSGSLDQIKSVKLLNLEIDYSEATILGMSEEDYSFYNENWYDGKELIYQQFKYMLDRECENHKFYNKPDAEYTVVFHVQSMDIKKHRSSILGYLTIHHGNDIICRVEGFSDKANAILNATTVFAASMRDMGDHIAEFFNDEE